MPGFLLSQTYVTLSFHQGETAMSKFAELRDQYNAKKTASKNHWEDLFFQVVATAKKFSAYLDIPAGAVVTIDGVQCPLLIVGIDKPDGFKIAKSRKEYERQGDGLLVDLMLVLETTEAGVPEKSVVYNLAIEKAGNSYILRDRRAGDAFNIKGDDYSAVLEHFYQVATQSI